MDPFCPLQQANQIKFPIKSSPLLLHLVIAMSALSDPLPVPGQPGMPFADLLVPLDEITPGAKARCGLIGPDLAQFLSTRDVIMAFYGKVWGDKQGEKAASARWEKVSDQDRAFLGDDLKTFRFAGGTRVSPVIAFSAVPQLCSLILKEKAISAMPAVIKLMQARFAGDPALIPDMPDALLGATSISFDCFKAGTSARLVVIDRMQYMALPDVVKTCSEDSYGPWRNLAPELKAELMPFIKEYQFSGILFLLDHDLHMSHI